MADLAEVIEQGHAQMQLHNLAIKWLRTDAFVQALESVHIRLKKVSPLVRLLARHFLQECRSIERPCKWGTRLRVVVKFLRLVNAKNL